MAYRIIGDAAMLLHFAFILYIALGGFLAWKWPRTLWAHLAVAAYGLAISVFAWTCPLTLVENWGRENAGRAGLAEEGFIDHYLTGVIYPAEALREAQAAVGALVVLSWAGHAVLTARRRRARAGTGVGGGAGVEAEVRTDT
ncbi:DUF2784 domain-containing protein [Nocardiopsis changdeensis]|uniref:DUF2784 domain-containing protein n=1 Tax=Nocardiopsis changdeensis TaxID=2831969 RepID=UPI003F45F4EA